MDGLSFVNFVENINFISFTPIYKSFTLADMMFSCFKKTIIHTWKFTRMNISLQLHLNNNEQVYAYLCQHEKMKKKSTLLDLKLKFECLSFWAFFFIISYNYIYFISVLSCYNIRVIFFNVTHKCINVNRNICWWVVICYFRLHRYKNDLQCKMHIFITVSKTL